PWFFIFTRIGYEVSSGLMFFMLGIYLMIAALRKKNLLLVGTFAFILSIYSYSSFRILVPIALIMFLFIHIYASKKGLLLLSSAIIIFIISLIPIIRLMIFDAGFGRVQSFVLLPTIQQVYDLSGKPHLQLIFDRSGSTDWGNNIRTIFKNYLVHFSPSFLLFQGDPNPRSHPAGSGQLFPTDLILVILGAYAVIRNHKQLAYLPIIFMSLGVIPAVLFRESPHALRSLTVVPFLSILMGIGVGNLIKYFKKASILILIIYLLSFVYFYQNFIGKYAQESSKHWQYGYKRLFVDYKEQFEDFDKIIISDEYAQPYIFALYYLKYSPEKFRAEVKYSDISNWGFSTVAKFGKFEFRKVQKDDLDSKRVLVFATLTDRPETKDSDAQIKFLDGETAFWVYNK
ncbi:hypothetical protein HYW43_02490, partial [Candidatus Daviesbacteria bacterium]|nr:hypothetical protein [Candidatus Daviesbacteria bacterium]